MVLKPIKSAADSACCRIQTLFCNKFGVLGMDSLRSWDAAGIQPTQGNLEGSSLSLCTLKIQAALRKHPHFYNSFQISCLLRIIFGNKHIGNREKLRGIRKKISNWTGHWCLHYQWTRRVSFGKLISQGQRGSDEAPGAERGGWAADSSGDQVLHGGSSSPS